MLLSTALPVLAATEEEGLASVKAFTLDHAGQLAAEAQAMQAAVADYAAVIAASGGDYAAAWAAEPERAEDRHCGDARALAGRPQPV